jgi:hypothetical protein
MISALLYGRNDGYGYNLAKRTALGLNTLAETLTHRDDEIVFVDCNTPDHFATLPESIADTLTARAKRLLRIIRLRPAQVQRLRGDSPLPLLEPHCRNIALRRSNFRNRWVLSTNPDMIFAPRHRFDSLSKIAARAADGFYHLPRFELPEALWESWDRMNPRRAMRLAQRAGDELRLNTVVETSPYARFAAPGDFQLAMREQMFSIHGFDERMTHGWHVDTNLAKRLWFLNGATGTLDAELRGYHCGHLRSAAAIHTSQSPANDYEFFVNQMRTTELPHQADQWGLAGESLEEITLHQPSRWSQWLSGVSRLQGQSLRLSYGSTQHWHDFESTLTHLASEWQHLPRDTRIAYLGTDERMWARLAELIRLMGFEHPLMLGNEDQVSLMVGGAEVIVVDGGLHTVAPEWSVAKRTAKALRTNLDFQHRLQRVSGWMQSIAASLGAEPAASPRFYLAGFWQSPVMDTLPAGFLTMATPPACGFVRATWRRLSIVAKDEMDHLSQAA